MLNWGHDKNENRSVPVEAEAGTRYAVGGLLQRGIPVPAQSQLRNLNLNTSI